SPSSIWTYPAVPSTPVPAARPSRGQWSDRDVCFQPIFVLSTATPPDQRATFSRKNWRMTITRFDGPLKVNRGLSTPTGQFLAGCQARLRDTQRTLLSQPARRRQQAPIPPTISDSPCSRRAAPGTITSAGDGLLPNVPLPARKRDGNDARDYPSI